jgi:hypothetical protein
VVFLTQTPKCWNCSHEPAHPDFNIEFQFSFPPPFPFSSIVLSFCLQLNQFLSLMVFSSFIPPPIMLLSYNTFWLFFFYFC